MVMNLCEHDRHRPSQEAKWCAAAFSVNFFIVQTSQLGWYGETNSVLSRRYQTFATPAGWAFSIWGYIFVSQLAFTIYTLLPSCTPYACDLVKRIRLPWISAQLFQVAWTLIFAQEMIALSLIAMIGIYLSLLMVTHRLCSVRVQDPSAPCSNWDFWLCHVPFQVHFGWITCASLVNISVVLRSQSVPLSLQLAAASSTLGTAALSSFASLMLRHMTAALQPNARRDACHAMVVAWALLALYKQLLLPDNPLPYSAAGTPYTEGLAMASLFFAFISAAGGVCCAVLCYLGVGGELRVGKQLLADDGLQKGCHDVEARDNVQH